MPGLQLTGLASGLDWRSLVDKLIAAERVPQDRLRTQKTLAQQKTNVLDALKTSLTALQASTQALSSGTTDVFAARTVTLANGSNGWTAGATASAEVGSHTIKIEQLATKAQIIGIPGNGVALSDTSDVSGLTIGTLPIGRAITAGEFTVNGSRVTIAATDSLQDVFDRISDATWGSVQASYDPVEDKVRLNGEPELMLGNSNDTSNFLTALGLTNNGTADVISPKALGVVSLSRAIADSNLRSAQYLSSGSFSINGVSIDFDVNTDSISTVFSRINASAAGVVAKYDASTDRFTLTNKTTGDTSITNGDSPGGLLFALGLNGSGTVARGKNAEYSVDGGAILTSPTNTLDGDALGIEGLTLTVASVGTDTVTVAGDTSKVRAKVEDFIAKFNAVQSFIEQQTRITPGSGGKVTAAIFAGNREVGDIATALRNKVFDSVPGLSGSIKRLEDLGIDFSTGKNELVIKDGAKLDAALSGRADQVRSLFSGTADGLAARLNSFLNVVTGTTGTLATQTKSLASQGSSIDDQIATMERHIIQQQRILEQSFIRMESAQAAIQNQLASLTSAFGTSGSTGK